MAFSLPRQRGPAALSWTATLAFAALITACGGSSSSSTPPASSATTPPATVVDPTSKIDTIVVIYGENRSFDNLYGTFPGANGIANALKNPAGYTQLDLDGKTPLAAFQLDP